MCVSSPVEADRVSGWSDTQHLAKESHKIGNNIVLPRRKIILQLNNYGSHGLYSTVQSVIYKLCTYTCSDHHGSIWEGMLCS